MADSRNEVLSRIRSRQWDGLAAPDLNQAWTRYDDPQHQFAETLKMVGGRCVVVNSVEEACADLRHFEPFAAAKKTVSCVPGVGCSNFDLASVTDPHLLEDVDFAILPGELAVAENAAVWVTDQNVPHRVLYFLPQHLALVVPVARLMHNMHEALAEVEPGRRAFGCFLAGPSKTADIEQSLVIGAHGARSLTVYLVDPA
ncbi:Lactate utilization protein C [Caulifigura coniformis]|uniref:Lactate utilization protein C n=1 Tax=Caulifigura coniformis TaxID=2527983 RepID=A0A517SEI2_9PLAN|nr:LUD domain-containing protein [Caulifigura coniformis]QDT54534.1 Lactate utilization protein C [Caulifigura coniformis]